MAFIGGDSARISKMHFKRLLYGVTLRKWKLSTCKQPAGRQVGLSPGEAGHGFGTAWHGQLTAPVTVPPGFRANAHAARPADSSADAGGAFY